MGQNLASCSVKELQEIATQIEKSLHIVRSRKVRDKTYIKEKYIFEYKMTDMFFHCMINYLSFGSYAGLFVG